MSTDPTSCEFDPMLALYSSEDPPLVTKAKVYDNVAMFEANMNRKQKGENSMEKPQSSRSSKSFSQNKKLQREVQSRDVSKLKQMMEMRKHIDQKGKDPEEEETPASKPRRKPRKNLFTSMEALSTGPMSIIHKIVEGRKRCQVYTRNFAGLRGVLVGFVVAYDRYMNMAMIDVDETFCQAPLGHVIEHQRKVTVSQIRQVLRDVRSGKGKAVPPNRQKRTQQLRHRSTTGVTYVRKSDKSNDKTEPRRSTEPNQNRPLPVKELSDRLKLLKFDGGAVQFFHRHIKQLYVRGDSVVLITIDTT